MEEAQEAIVRRLNVIGVFTDFGINHATVTLSIRGRHETAQGSGNGPVSAIIHAIRKMVNHEGTPRLDRLYAEGEGEDATGMASITIVLDEGGEFQGEASGSNVVIAITDAYLAALNPLLAFVEKRDDALHQHSVAICHR